MMLMGRIGIKYFDVLSSGKTRRHGKLAERMIALVPCTDIHDIGVYSSASLFSASDTPPQVESTLIKV
jgi:hypothetical protein